MTTRFCVYKKETDLILCFVLLNFQVSRSKNTNVLKFERIKNPKKEFGGIGDLGDLGNPRILSSGNQVGKFMRIPEEWGPRGPHCKP